MNLKIDSFFYLQINFNSSSKLTVGFNDKEYIHSKNYYNIVYDRDKLIRSSIEILKFYGMKKFSFPLISRCTHKSIIEIKKIFPTLNSLYFAVADSLISDDPSNKINRGWSEQLFIRSQRALYIILFFRDGMSLLNKTDILRKTRLDFSRKLVVHGFSECRAYHLVELIDSITHQIACNSKNFSGNEAINSKLAIEQIDFLTRDMNKMMDMRFTS